MSDAKWEARDSLASCLEEIIKILKLATLVGRHFLDPSEIQKIEEINRHTLDLIPTLRRPKP